MGDFDSDYIERFNFIKHSKERSLKFTKNFANFANKLGFNGIYLQYSSLHRPTGIIIKAYEPWIQEEQIYISHLGNSVKEARMTYQNLTFILGIDIYDHSGFDSWSKLKEFDLVILEWNSGLRAYNQFGINNHWDFDKIIMRGAKEGIKIAISIDFFGYIEHSSLQTNRILMEENVNIEKKLSMGTCNMLGNYKHLPYYWVTFKLCYSQKQNVSICDEYKS